MAASPGATLVGLRFAIGSGAWGAPNRTGKLFGLDPGNNPQAPFVGRLFGVREVALAVLALRSTGPSKRLVWQLGVLCDVLDAGAAMLARRNRTLPTPAALMVGATALGAAGLGVAALYAED
jgi:hypothetical protein